jgi:hypothetical protein
MTRNRTLLAIGIALVAVAAGGGAYAYAGGGDDDGEGNATGPGADRARQVAVAHLGGGTANEVERGDEEGAWEVEVTKSNGETVDVHLDTSFKVLSVEGDSEDDAGDTD